MDKILFLNRQILGQKCFWTKLFWTDFFYPRFFWRKQFLERKFFGSGRYWHLSRKSLQAKQSWFKPMGQISDLQLTSFWYILVGGCSCCCCYRGKTKSTPRLKSWSRSGVWQKQILGLKIVLTRSIFKILRSSFLQTSPIC